MRALPFLALALAGAALAQEPAKGHEHAGVERADVGARLDDQEEILIERATVERMGVQVDDWFHDGEYPAAISALRLQTEMWPWHEDTATSLAWMLGNIQRRDEEIAQYMRYIRRNPENPDGPHGAATFYLLKRDFVMVIHLLAPTLKMKTKPHANNYTMLANSYRKLGMYKPALDVYEQLLKLKPGDLTVIMNRNRVAVELGLPEIKAPG